jgi:hypothetical protein
MPHAPSRQPCLAESNKNLQERRARAAVDHADAHHRARSVPTQPKHLEPLPPASMYPTVPGDRQTCPFHRPYPVATARRRVRRLGLSEHREFLTIFHRPYMRIKDLEHRQETTDRSPPSAMPLASRSRVATVACPSRSVSPSSL